MKLPAHATLWKATPAIALLTAAAILGVGLAIGLFADHAYQAQKRREIGVQGQILASTLTAALSFQDRDAAQEYVDALQQNPEVQAVAAYDIKGALFASYVRSSQFWVPASAPAAGEMRESGTVAVATPVIERGLAIGTVFVEAETEPLDRRLARFASIALLMAMFALILGLLGIAQRTLARANADLAAHAAMLNIANETLRQQIAEREKAEEALRHTQKIEAIGQLTGGVAHDFNNILQVVLGGLGVLRRRAGKWPIPDAARADFERYLDEIVAASQRGADLTRQLLAFARRQPLEPKDTDINKLVQGMSGLMQPALGEQVEIETVLAGGLWRTQCDTNQLENALLNLAVNARDAMPNGGHLTIETANAHLDEEYARWHQDVAPGQYVMIAVTDTGAGMPQDVLAHVFEPFFTTKEVGRGTGLGLSQVYGFLKQSGGHVAIYSEVGLGTTVKLYLPRCWPAAEPAPPLPTQEPREAARAATETVLVVEDDESVLELAIATLGDLGYRVVPARDGAEALRQLAAHPAIELLFTDVGLPGGMNGRQLADRAREARPDLKVLFTSGYTRNAIVHGGRLDEGVALIGKPFTADALAEKIRQVLDT
ncbi:MAG TPA: ATP-binding protein [Magnetospirillaceae bacterium]|nr:ATP-binding protein [Magnetospirillaceae bacterium]